MNVIFLKVFLFLGITLGCATRPGESLTSPRVATLWGNTPGDAEVKSMLSIAQEIPVDFIHWKLELGNGTDRGGKFTLSLQYGLSKNGTRTWQNGGAKKELKGVYFIDNRKNDVQIKLSYGAPATSFFLTLINENVFQLLNRRGGLMNGNGGWSYTLNRKFPVKGPSRPAFHGAALIFGPDDQVDTVRYDGRSACAEVARDRHIAVSSDCFKLKWAVILRRDPRSKKPSSFEIWQIDHQRDYIRGVWRVDTTALANSMVLRLIPNDGGETLNLFVGDRNVLFMLDRSFRLYEGNGEYSYTLNRK